MSTITCAQATIPQLCELMVGRELPTPETRESTVTDVVELSVEGLGVRADGQRWLLQDVSFEVRRGEVVGIAGVEGNGQQELVEAILGLRRADVGTIRLAGEDVSGWTTRQRRAGGIAYIPEDRHHRGLVLPFPIWENAMLGQQDRAPFSSGPWLRGEGARERAAEIVERFDVRTPGVDVPTYALSGGNQQKLIIGRELTSEPSVLVAAHPTRGIDVGAQAAVWDELRNARAAGLAILLVSADLEEIIGLSDTLKVMFRGRLAATLDPAEVTPEQLGLYMTGGLTEGAAGEGGAA